MPKYADRPQVTEVQTLFYPDPLMKPPSRLPDKIVQNNRQINLDLDMEINKDFEENSPYQEGIISEIYQRLDKLQLVEPPELLDSLLFKLNLEKEKAVLAIPEVCLDQIIALYHSSLFAGYQGVVKTYLTMTDKFFIPDLMHYLHSYIKGCHICQLSKKDEIPNRQFQTRINLNYKPLSRLSMDLKVMPKSHQGHKVSLCVID